MSIPLAERIATAPISWGVCEVPEWGYQLQPDVVLAQMHALGLRATEFGPDGFLPAAPADKAATLRAYGLAAVGQFIPVVLNDQDSDPLSVVQDAMTALLAAAASTVVVAAATGGAGYDDRPALSAQGWSTMLANLDRINDVAADRGLVAALHPHIGTMVESGEETARVLTGSRIGLCLDTGHLLIGGGDPVAVAVTSPERITHCHLKDVKLELARRVHDGSLSYTDAVAQGMYVPLGAGDVDIAAIVTALEDAGYQGWYVLEQDTILTGPPEQTGVDPATDVAASADHIRALASHR